MDTYSRFNTTDIITLDNNVKAYSMWRKPSLLEREYNDDEVFYYQVQNNEAAKPHIISNNVYGTTLLDWLIIAFNLRHDVFGWPKAGTIIKLIKPIVVSEEIF